MSTTEINTAPAKKTIKFITFRRTAIKNYYETYDLTYNDFVAKISKDGWEGKEIKDKSIIKELWDELAEDGVRCWNDSAVVIDVDSDTPQYDGEDEDWDEDDAEENIWDFIENFDYNCTITPEPEKTPEQKAEEEKAKEKERLEWIAKVEEDRLKQIAWREEKEAKQKEYAKKQKEEEIENAPEAIRRAILTTAKLYNERMDEAKIAEDGEEQWKVKAMKNVAQNRLLNQMNDLVVQLKMVAKW
jgi:hypothetical protein